MKKTIFLIAAIIVFIVANFGIADTIEVDPATPLDHYISLGEWNTPGDVDGFTQSSDITGLTVAGGTISGTVSGNDPWIRKDSPTGVNRYNLSPGSIIEIRIKYDADASLTNNPGNFGFYYFNDGNWHAIAFLTGAKVQIDGQFHVYRLTISADNSFTWITRVDMFPSGFAGQSFEIDYIRAKLPLMADPVYEGGKALAYTSLAEWNTADDFENWSVANMDAFVAAGYLTATNNGDGQIYKDNTAGLPMIGLDSDKIVEIRLRRETTDAGTVQIFYGTTNTPGASGARTLSFIGQTVARDGDFHIYQFDFETQSAWMGALQLLRFDPTAQNGVVLDVDYIRIGKVIPEPTSIILLALLGLAFIRRK